MVCVCTVQEDLYSALGVPRSANKAQIKAAYRRAVRDCHPDVNPSLAAARRFQVHAHLHYWYSSGTQHKTGPQLLQDAYDVLLDERARQRYNQQLDNASKRDSPRMQGCLPSRVFLLSTPRLLQATARRQRVETCMQWLGWTF